MEPMRACSVASVVFHFATPWTIALQVPLCMGFSAQEYWSGLPCPPPENLLNPGTKPTAPALQAFLFFLLTTKPPGWNPPPHKVKGYRGGMPGERVQVL